MSLNILKLDTTFNLNLYLYLKFNLTVNYKGTF